MNNAHDFNRNIIGAKYDANLDVTDIAKLVRTEIKSALKNGEVPKAKYSVRISRFSGGQSIDITVSGLPFAIRIDNDAEVEAGRGVVAKPWLTREAFFLENKLEAMLAAYNFDKGNSMTDYFHVNFYGHVYLSGLAP